MKEKITKCYQKHKVWMISGLLVAIVIIGVGSWYMLEQQHKQNILDSMDLVFIDNLEVEYGQKDVDLDAFIKEKKGDPQVTVPNVKIDTKVLGKQELVYKLSKDGYTKAVSISIEIKDTKAPEITIKDDSIELTEGDEFDPMSNIGSVKDSVDGDIKKSEDEKIIKDGYFIKSDVDTSTPNEYKVTITAYDINGNKSTKEFTVVVNEKQVEQQQPSYTGGRETTGGTTNGTVSNDGNSSENQPTGSGSSAPAEPYYRTDISSTYASQINAYRQQNGLEALPITGECQAEADMRAMQLVSSYGHNASLGFGENIGEGTVGYDFFQAWQASPTHNASMLERSMYSAMAVSVVEYNGQLYAVTSFKMKYY